MKRLDDCAASFFSLSGVWLLMKGLKRLDGCGAYLFGLSLVLLWMKGLMVVALTSLMKGLKSLMKLAS